jgi:hypothetical protein
MRIFLGNQDQIQSLPVVRGRDPLEEDFSAGMEKVGIDPSSPGVQRFGEGHRPVHVLHHLAALLDVVPAAAKKPTRSEFRVSAI